MSRMSLTPAAAGLVRALIARGGTDRARILLSAVVSQDWQSLTFTGEQHRIELRLTGDDVDDLAAMLCDGLEDAELTLPGAILADIAIVGAPCRHGDGSLTLRFEALTLKD